MSNDALQCSAIRYGCQVGASDDLKSWFGRVFHGPDGEPVMTLSELAARAKIARTTLHRLKAGRGIADQQTLDAVARVLGVEAPRIVVALGHELATPTPFDQLREAQVLIETASARLAAMVPRAKRTSHASAAEAAARALAGSRKGREHGDQRGA